MFIKAVEIRELSEADSSISLRILTSDRSIGYAATFSCQILFEYFPVPDFNVGCYSRTVGYHSTTHNTLLVSVTFTVQAKKAT